jgi:uncharacterized integral membrane protein
MWTRKPLEPPAGGGLAPSEFISLAERTGLIDELTTWLLTQATTTVASWRHPNAPPRSCLHRHHQPVSRPARRAFGQGTASGGSSEPAVLRFRPAVGTDLDIGPVHWGYGWCMSSDEPFVAPPTGMTPPEPPTAGAGNELGRGTAPADEPRVSGQVRRTRTGGVWVGLVSAAVVLILLLIFILQNSDNVTIHFFGFHRELSLAVALLLSAVCGVLLVAIPGTGRIVQLRRAVKKRHRPRGHR